MKKIKINYYEMYSTPLDVLYLVLSIVIGALGLFLVIALFHLIKILSNVNKVTSKVKDTIDLINHYLWQPIKFTMSAVEKMKDVAKKKK